MSQVSRLSIIFFPVSDSIPLLFIMLNYCVCIGCTKSSLSGHRLHTSSLNFSPCPAIFPHLCLFPVHWITKRLKIIRLWSIKCMSTFFSKSSLPTMALGYIWIIVLLDTVTIKFPQFEMGVENYLATMNPNVAAGCCIFLLGLPT